jgi:mxaJ protein
MSIFLHSLVRRVGAAALVSWLAAAPAAASVSLRVCADPDNLPFSNEKEEGYENKIAAVLAKDMGATLSYTWLKQRQNFFRQTLGADRCDVVIGVPVGFERVLSTKPYYRSSYVIVTPRKRDLVVKSYDDAVLRGWKIGVHAIGNDGANSPPAAALARHGLATNTVGYSMWGDGLAADPQGQVIDAVAKGDIDAAIVWGPLGGYFAGKYGDALTVTPAPTDPGMPEMRFAFDIAMGVRKDDTVLAAKLETSIERNRREIREILSSYHVPLVETDAVSAPPQPTAVKKIQ